MRRKIPLYHNIGIKELQTSFQEIYTDFIFRLPQKDIPDGDRRKAHYKPREHFIGRIPHQEEGEERLLKREEEEEGLFQREGEEIFFTQRKEGEVFLPQAATEWGQEKEDEESGLLRDRFFIGIHLRLRRGIRYF